MKAKRNTFTTILALPILGSIILASCAPAPTAAPTRTPTRAPAPTAAPTRTPNRAPSPTATSVPLPALTLEPGDSYFSLDGQPAMILFRNITGITRTDFGTALEWAQQGGTRVIRVHLTSGWWGDPWINQDWTVNETWAQNWDWLFDQAQADGIYVLPVFGVWADWNTGIPDFGGPGWQYNPLNQANGGPLTDPGELFRPGSTTQEMWLAWVEALVQRWQGRENIAAWEIFSEINIASGTPGQTDARGAVAEAAAVDFTNLAAETIRAADTFDRPVTLSLAGGSGMPLTDEWADVYRLNTLDFIQIHPYTAQLDRELVSDVRSDITEFRRPVLIGESGLWGDLAIAENASIGVKHAIWAGMVSGAMNARALWSNDGYAFLQPDTDRTLALEYMQLYATAELPAADFISGVDFTGFEPLTATSTSMVWGAAVGNENSIIGWFRDAACEPPDWNVQPIPAGQTVTIAVPGSSMDWQVDFYDTQTGTTILSSASVIRQGGMVTVTLPSFTDDIAFKMTTLSGAPEATPASSPAETTTDSIAGNWSGTITSAGGDFSTPIELHIQAGCAPGNPCGTFAAPQVSCAGDLFLQSISNATFLFQELNVTGASSCPSGGYEQLQLNNDGSLAYQYLVTPESAAMSTGILNRP